MKRAGKKFSTIQQLEKNIDVGTILYNNANFLEWTAIVLSRTKNFDVFRVKLFILGHREKSEIGKICNWQIGAPAFYEVIT